MKNIIEGIIKTLLKVMAVWAVLILVCTPINVSASSGTRTIAKAVQVGKTSTIFNVSNVTSSKKTVAKVEKEGSNAWKITALKNGKTKLKTYNENGTLLKTIYLLVYSDKTLNYDTSAIKMAENSSKKYQATVPSGCNVKYSSSNRKVAEVGAGGKIIAMSKGTATIKAVVYFKNAKIKTFKKKVTVYAPNNISSYVFIGDSRTVRMHKHVGNPIDVTWSAASGQGYDWMMAEGLNNVESSIRKNTAVFILLGANDLWNIDSYIETINKKALEWKSRGARVIFCSVGPVDPSLTSKITNEDIEQFNKMLKKGLVNAEYFDLYTLLQKNGFGTNDGLHYTKRTSRFIYNYLRGYALYTEF